MGKNPASVPATLRSFDTTQATAAPSGGVRIVYQDNWPGTVDAQGVANVEKAPSHGYYVDKNGNRVKVREGGAIPEGMTFEAGDWLKADEKPVEERAEADAPENRMLTAAPENRAADKAKKAE
jgi:hypothetical protein